MERIVLRDVLPEVFASRNDIVSDIWLKDVTFCRGELCLMEAASGTGKSSLCSYITGYRNDYKGRILFDDADICSMGCSSWVEIRRSSLSHMYQELRLFPELTALENVMIKNNLTHHLNAGTIRQWFERLGLEDKMESTLGRMSFGQQQRVAMMRALAQPFDFLLVDEPVSHLDEENSRIMAEIMMSEARRQGAGVLVTSIGKHMDLAYDKIFRL